MTIWKIIPGFSKYEISDEGKLRNKKTKYIFKSKPTLEGYIRCLIVDDEGKRNMKGIHYLVCLTFYGEKPSLKHTVDHINRIRNDNRLENLRWATKSEQIQNQNKLERNNGLYVLQINPKSNKIINVYKNNQEAGNAIGVSKTAIRQAIINNRFCKGYKWMYETVKIIEGERWKKIKLNNKILYISSLGRTKDEYNRELKQHISTSKYNQICCNNKQYYIHRLVAINFIKNLDNKEYVNHKDGNKLNNKLENLEWVTNQENCQHAWNTKLNNVVNNIKVYLIDIRVSEIIKEFNSIKDAMKYNKISYSTMVYYLDTKIINNIYLWSRTPYLNIKIKKIYKINLQKNCISSIYYNTQQAAKNENLIPHTLRNRIRNKTIKNNIIYEEK